MFFSPLTSRGVWQYALITHRIGLSQIAQMPQIIFIIQLICVSQSPRGGRWAYCHTPLRHRMGLTQIDLIKQIYYFLLRFPRFLRETPLPLADCADVAENLYNRINLCEPITHPGLRLPCSITQIDLIKQILLFSSAVSAISARYSSSSRRLRRCRRTGVHLSASITARRTARKQLKKRLRQCDGVALIMSHPKVWRCYYFLMKGILATSPSAVIRRM